MSLLTHLGDRVDAERQKRFTAAHAACHDTVYRYFRRRTANPSTAEDLCAEVFRIAWEKSAHNDDLSAMVLFGIAHNVLRNHMRSSARSANLLSALFLERLEQETDAVTFVRDAVDQLKPDDREVLLLTYWDGFTSSEVSNLLNTSATAIRMRLHRARKALGRLLQNEPESQESKR